MMEIIHLAYGLEIRNVAHTRITAWLDVNSNSLISREKHNHYNGLNGEVFG